MRDQSDFDTFYAGSVRRLTSQMYAMTGSRAEAEDLVHEAFARAWQRWEKVSGYADPEAWVRTVACRIRVSAWRKAVNRLAAHRRHGMPEDVPGASPDYVAIVAALRRIPAEQRRAIVLHHLVGLSVEEIARETGAAVGTVKARLSRGRQAMAPHLSDPDSDLAPDTAPAPSAAGVGRTFGLGPTDQEVRHHA
ncbi:SigE family RNA polymerase sigma factor [Streptomyces sp. RB6PN25]|uniref:SigE family RNA polymerase sigma factor n=1 Tax=Streptomyces humicola TaxID=2953240 RepID=A0ABT1PVJ6_9ACTN|nr:SigE family RNA polymerase sigma factor [Streptomyces humicola]MCQ4081689.1 SigE family RNA polymerase sigma factor [Streptomyces humicola]